MESDGNPLSFNSLLEQFELTKKELVDAEKSIRRLTGRDPDIFPGENNKGQQGLGKPRFQQLPNSDKSFAGRKRPLFPIVKPKEEEGEVPQEDSPDEDETPTKKPSLLSTVVAHPKDSKSRRETIKEQNINSKVKARNRRMFGMILGTLQKFQHDAKKREEKDLKRAEIEQKVEAAAAEEKERIKKEKEDLFQCRREKQAQLRCLEKKIEIAEMHEAWEKNEKYKLNFIMTKSEPIICFLPKTHNSKTTKCLEASKRKTMECIKERREKMEKEIQEVEELYKRSNFLGDKENIGPSEEEEGLNELIDTQEQNSQQESAEAQSELQDTSQQPLDSVESTAPADETQEILSNTQNLQNNNDEVSVKLEETSTVDSSNTIANACELTEDNAKTEDFEPIYD